MAKLNAKTIDSIGGENKYFGLKDDGDSAFVRFLLNKKEEIFDFVYSVHEIEDSKQKKHTVNCLREEGGTVDDCPFCKAKIFIKAQAYIPVYDVDLETVGFWSRGKTMVSKLMKCFERVLKDSDSIAGTEIEIVRNGKAGDSKTSYDLYPTKNVDETTVEDYPEIPKILGEVVLDLSKEDMIDFLDTQTLPKSGKAERTLPKRTVREGRESRDEEEAPSRKGRVVREDPVEDGTEEDAPKRRIPRGRK